MKPFTKALHPSPDLPSVVHSGREEVARALGVQARARKAWQGMMAAIL